MLNGVPGKNIHYKRGVRQGDPLSPLLFVLAADRLQSILNKAKDRGLLNLPIPLNSSSDFPIIQYADDTLIILEGEARQLFFLKSVLHSFSESTGLKVNYSKSQMLPINLSDAKFDQLANTFGCSKGSFPFTYLGLPLGITKPKVNDFLPLVSKCERRLACASSFLSQAGRLELTNVVLTALPTFHLCALALPKGVIKQIDKFRKHRLWRGSDLNLRKPSQAAWELVYKPKEEGGLGVLDLQKQNEALLMKNLDKFMNRRDIPWVTMVWEKHYPNGKLPGNTKKKGLSGGKTSLVSFGKTTGCSSLSDLNIQNYILLQKTDGTRFIQPTSSSPSLNCSTCLSPMKPSVNLKHFSP